MNKIERRVYTEDDIQFIKDNYQKGDDYLCKELSRGKGSVSSKRNSLGLRSPNFKKDSYWTKDEDKIIKENYLKGDPYIKTLLPHRSVSSIKQHRLKYLKLKNNQYSKRNPIWRTNKNKIIKDFTVNELTLTEVSNKYGLNIETLRDNLIENELYNPIPKNGREFIYSKNWLKYKDVIIQKYNDGLSIKELHEKYNISDNCLRNNLEYEGVYIPHSSSNVYVDRTFFEKIDNPTKSYFLGLMDSDGSVSSKDNRISLSIIDKEVVEDFKRSLKSGHSIIVSKPKKSKIKFHQIQYSLQINNRKIKSDLIDKGCKPLKTYDLKFPNEKQVPNQLIIPFMYGYFDGDGHIGFLKQGNSKSMRLTFEIIGTREFMEGYKKHLLKFLNDELGIIDENCIRLKDRIHKQSTVPITHLTISDTFIRCKVFELLMNSYPSKMKRKVNKFKDFLKWFKNNPTFERNGNTFKRYKNYQEPMMELVKKYV